VLLSRLPLKTFSHENDSLFNLGTWCGMQYGIWRFSLFQQINWVFKDWLICTRQEYKKFLSFNGGIVSLRSLCYIFHYYSIFTITIIILFFHLDRYDKSAHTTIQCPQLSFFVTDIYFICILILKYSPFGTKEQRDTCAPPLIFQPFPVVLPTSLRSG